jgi:curved DNA-binding protein
MSMDFKDYYKILGVDRTADQKAISAAYRKLARQHHPDVNKTRGAEDRFKEINEAYQVLGDPERRARYDQVFEAYQRGGPNWEQTFGRGGWAQTPGGWTVVEGTPADLEDLLGGLGFSEFFRQFFGAEFAGARGRGGADAGGAVRAQASRRPQVESTIDVTLEDAFAGTRKALTVQSNGRPRRFDVTIPTGVRDGQKIRLAGALDGSNLILTVRIQPHPYFERRDDDVSVEVPVTPAEAVLGATIEVPTLEGKVEMVIPPGTQSGQVFRLRGQGMPRPGGGRGDQLVEIRVVVPEKPSPRERQLFEELGKLGKENPRAHLGRK